MNMTDISLIQFNRLKLFSGVASTITRGNVTLSPMVVLFQADSQSISARDAIFIAGLQDIGVTISDHAGLGEPEEGDVYVYEQGGETITAEARPLNENDPCFIRWDGNAVYRVHCKVVDRTPVE